MKMMTVEEVEGSLRDALRLAADEDVIIMDGDELVGILQGLASDDDGDDAPFWVEDDPEIREMIERSRSQPSRPLAEVLADLEHEDAEREAEERPKRRAR